MPFYTFTNLKTQEKRDIFFHMNDEKIYNGDGDREVNQWVREYLSPNASIDTEMDAFDPKSFMKATNKPDSLGSLFDRSKELSLKRADKEGIDPVRQKFYENYQKTHGGKKHHAQAREESVRVAKDAGISIDYGSDD